MKKPANIKHSISKIKMYRGNEEYRGVISLVEKESIKTSHVLKMLHELEKEHYQTIKFERRRLSYLLGRFSAKLAVNAISNTSSIQSINIDSGVFGFPIVLCSEATNIQVSISHCDTIGMSVAFPESHPMGIDIEKICTSNEKTFLNLISKQEIELLKSVGINSISGYTTLWCIKESLSKVIKTGMMLDIPFLEIDSITKEGNTFVSTFKQFGQYKAMCFINKKYAISIVLPRRTITDLHKTWKIFDTYIMELPNY